MIDFGFFGPWTWIFGIVGRIIPVDKRAILFGSNQGMHASDNSLALFRHMNKNPRNLKAMWITRKKEVYERIENEFPGKVVMAFSLRGLFAYFRSWQIVISHSYLDMCLMPYSRKKKVNYLWHGVPIRKIGKMLPEEKNSTSKGIVKHWSRWNRRVDYFFASCEYEGRIMKEAFRIDGMEIIVSGYPRNDRLIEIANKKNKVHEKRDFTILYAPTYRILKTGDKSKIIPLLHPGIEIGEMHNFLEKNECRLIVRPHPLLPKIQFDSDRIECISVDDEPDLSVIFEKSDLLVTDYSSAYFDWLILGRPVIFSVFDISEYCSEIGLIAELGDIAAGEIVYTKEGVFSSLEGSISKHGKEELEISEIRGRFGIKKEGACEKVAEFLESRSNQG